MKKFIRYTYARSIIGKSILGVIIGDSRFPDNHRLLTSMIVSEYEKENLRFARTESGSIYELGEYLEPTEFFEKEKRFNSNGIAAIQMKEILGLTDKNM